MAWLLASFQMLVAPISLLLDTRSFLRPLSNSIMQTLELFYVLLVTLGLVFGPVRTANVFQLYILPQRFRLFSLAFMFVVSVLLTVVMLFTRFCLAFMRRGQVGIESL